MFRFHKTLDVITLFHRPSIPSSIRVNNLLKKISAQASETATEDQVGDHAHHNKLQRAEFELNVTEDPPTSDQLKSILDYVGNKKAGLLVEGAKDAADAVRKLGENPQKFKSPVVVDWNNGKAVIGDNESEILSMIEQQSKDSGGS